MEIQFEFIWKQIKRSVWAVGRIIIEKCLAASVLKSSAVVRVININALYCVVNENGKFFQVGLKNLIQSSMDL